MSSGVGPSLLTRSITSLFLLPLLLTLVVEEGKGAAV